jgi:hypothetical protein
MFWPTNHLLKKKLARDGNRITATLAVTSHDGSQIPHKRLVTVIRLLQVLMLLIVISSLPNLLTAVIHSTLLSL